MQQEYLQMCRNQGTGLWLACWIALVRAWHVGQEEGMQIETIRNTREREGESIFEGRADGANNQAFGQGAWDEGGIRKVDDGEE